MIYLPFYNMSKGFYDFKFLDKNNTDKYNRKGRCKKGNNCQFRNYGSKKFKFFKQSERE